jgi:predicted ATP-grasp superfamily ATP-dependent carboligase
MRGHQSLSDLASELVFPLLVKPLSSYRFGSKFGGKKFFTANDVNELRQATARTAAAGVEFMLVELIPGPDDRLCSYYTYLDKSGTPQFDFTKRIVRRFPTGMGNGCYHITDWNPALREPSLRLFRQAGLRGLANAEFKWDERDSQFKLIECNARFTAANCLVTSSGIDLASFVYNRITGRPNPTFKIYRTGLRLWYPWQDFRAFLELRRQGKMSFWGWLASVAHSQTFPYFQWYDPFPSVVRSWQSLASAGRCRGLVHRVGSMLATWLQRSRTGAKVGGQVDNLAVHQGTLETCSPVR